MSTQVDDLRWMQATIALAARSPALAAPNPCVGCIVVKDGVAIGRGVTAKGGRPHAEAMALEQAGEAARGATVYVTLEPCAHKSNRGPACSDLLSAAQPERVVIALTDPDPRTAGSGTERMRAAGIAVAEGVAEEAAAYQLAGYLSQQKRGRPHIMLKLATSLDGQIAMTDGTSQWITGEASRAHAHGERARFEAILVGRETLRQDTPRLDVRLPGLEERSPERIVLSRSPAPQGWTGITAPEAVHDLEAQSLMIEGGAGAAAAFLRTDLVDELLLYRAPVLIGEGRTALGDIGLTNLSDAHGQWRRIETRHLGNDQMERYLRTRAA
ncbi:bifunctional diaminohydroxyphosphoribosylaminopyrimidine deaminase/5-amino-6-(5-phosphoribosylamino)uracil reductase RibD [Alterisphingorhabdus coralli]|uniref:Riboflavin biosynthesis protein RibD n=1 Tax=Alterisphingorhabdus coralli TaxID=3071408 RepID=A0AA97F7L4_9SPHN|nr:bifunctional diaminohydroxyphosphoribosylaminopyrimidine deaminase/5-amino-6-(5-phosphoribosylamino)uracil reductase RibD [Parasphingorhabdus sp. SCSIO 66989]WOE75406.1 bifunctional diaminohydroxyphosphoribosylaminopyrimidine deaminase/5-amino-6-(5-phosphoribosylamino)uracil reductase RibD [Parasphingorhabdus sp. SCSIO 66989]